MPKLRKLKFFPLHLYRVSGDSMLPSYREGDILLGITWTKFRPGQVVVVQRDFIAIKRIVRIEPEGIWLEGDNSDHSTDSRHYGLVPTNAVIARIFFKFS